MTNHTGTTPPRTRRANVALRLAGGAVVASLIVAGTTGAISTATIAQQQAVRAHVVSLIDTSHRVSAATLRAGAAEARLTAALTEARAEIVRADGILASSAGKASDAGRAALGSAIAAVTATLTGSSAYGVLGTVMTLRENEKAVTDSVAAWQKAENERLAAAAAAQAAAVAAQEYSAAHATVSHFSSTRSATAPSSTATTYYAPGVSSTRPSNDPCGPCPGATLVLIQGYWGCP